MSTTLLIHAYCLQKLQNIWLSIPPLITSNREIDLAYPLINGPILVSGAGFSHGDYILHK